MSESKEPRDLSKVPVFGKIKTGVIPETFLYPAQDYHDFDYLCDTLKGFGLKFKFEEIDTEDEKFILPSHVADVTYLALFTKR